MNIRTSNRRQLRKVQPANREIGPIGCHDFSGDEYEGKPLKFYLYMLWGNRELRHTPKAWA